MQSDKTIAMAFTEDQALRLTGLTRRQLRYWRATGFFHASTGQFYSFRDLVGLRTIAQLRRERIPLQELRKIGAWLREKHETPWASLTFYVSGKHVFVDDGSGVRESRRPPKQTAIPIGMKRIADETLSLVRKDRERKREQVGHVEKRRGVMGSQPVIAGTRVSTAAIWDFHSEGFTPEQICEQYPGLRVEDVRAAIAHERQRPRRMG